MGTNGVFVEGTGYPIRRHKRFYCLCCGEELWKKEHHQKVNGDSSVGHRNPFDIHVVGDCLYIHEVLCCYNSKCIACNKNVEYHAQITIEDTNKKIKRIEKNFRKNGFDITIETKYLTKDDEISDTFLHMSDCKEVYLQIYLSGELIGIYKTPVSCTSHGSSDSYYKIKKSQLVKHIKYLLISGNKSSESVIVSYVEKPASAFIKVLKKLPFVIIIVAWFAFIYGVLIPFLKKIGLVF